MKVLTIFSLVSIAATLSFSILKSAYADDDAEWEKFKQDFNKTYDTAEEEALRKAAFLANLALVNKLNEKEPGSAAINVLSDRTDEEWDAMLPDARPYPTPGPNPEGRGAADIDVRSLPETIDWNQQGYVTNVRNQGRCNSCWAFASVGALESAYAIKYGVGVAAALSVQNLVDCVQWGGCKSRGYYMDYALEWIMGNRGVATYAEYPDAPDNGTCRNNAVSRNAPIYNYTLVQPQGNELALQAAVAKGPVAIDYVWTKDFYLNPAGRIFSPDTCASNYSHAMLAVGYGREGNQDYWLLKNSWGEGWGMGGYVKVARNAGNVCGIADWAYYPTVL